MLFQKTILNPLFPFIDDKRRTARLNDLSTNTGHLRKQAIHTAFIYFLAEGAV